MDNDEEGTLQKLKKCSEIIKSIISKNDGRIFNTAGDAFMIEFFSPIMALNSAISIQLEINSLNSQSKDIPMEFRIGLNLGDVMVEEENLFGAGVNIAARLEGICPPSGICMSEKIYLEVKDKSKYNIIDIGPQKLKNIDTPIQSYVLSLPGITNSKKLKLKKNVFYKSSKFFFTTLIGLSPWAIIFASIGQGLEEIFIDDQNLSFALIAKPEYLIPISIIILLILFILFFKKKFILI